MRVCVFVDGENFRHSIVDLFSPQFQQEDYLPKSADWASLFDWIVKNVVDNGERVRTYWYVIKTLDFFPWSFPNPTKLTDPIKIREEQNKLQKLLSKHRPYKAELDALDDTRRPQRMMDIVDELNQRQKTLEKRFDGWIALQEGITLKHKAIEFRRAGAMKCDLFQNTLGREKAVDVKLACDLITLKDIYDIAIIVTGDQDYVPAVEVIKDCGKRIVNVAFLTRGGQLLPGGARRLNQVTDWSFNIPFDTLADHLHIRQLPLP